MPGKCRGANTEYLRRTIPEFHAKGARFYTGEGGDNWGCNGLGYYLAAPMLWDVRGVDHIEELTGAWKKEEPFTRGELDGFVRSGITTRKLLDFTPVSVTNDLVPATKLALAEVTGGQYDRHLHRSRTFFTWIEHAPATLKFSATTGWIYQNRGSAKLELYAAADAEMKSNAQAEIAPDKKDHLVQLATIFTGLHRIEVTD